MIYSGHRLVVVDGLNAAREVILSSHSHSHLGPPESSKTKNDATDAVPQMPSNLHPISNPRGLHLLAPQYGNSRVATASAHSLAITAELLPARFWSLKEGDFNGLCVTMTRE
ncbi:uncharacterized protein APUU_10983A [Aspergillus puulaauensis]|uniref:Uncharacterized protein n=1 Tax=Aspergillus puulaauensis TaxID=1220207 RepID=A0A7R7XBD5_9EURO|nr:uncharacterized protein APUU_10983A [Aspergillus puulaauensis]BCS18155.1 hypothetical protein APUU_10983A [Aspergillus puulaauensis]